MSVEPQKMSSPLPRRIAVYAGRALVCIAVVALGIWAMAGLSTLTGQPSEAPTAPKPGNEAPAVAGDAWTTPLHLAGGGWMIGELPWELRVQRLSRKEIESELLKPPPAATGTPSPFDRDILNILKGLATEKRTQAGHHTYSLSLGEGQAVLITGDTPQGERLLCARVTFAGPDGSVALVEALPIGSATPKPLATSELLPLPQDVRRLATRRDAQGGLVAELVLVDNDPVALQKSWQRLGYQTENVVDRQNTVRGVTCSKEGQVVHAWFWPGQGRQTVLLQVRTSPEVMR